MKKLLVTLFFILLPFSIFAVGFSDWKEKSPEGNEINNFNGTSLILKDGSTVDGIWKWFFFKKHIAGTIANPSEVDMKVSYFVTNEKTMTTKYFKSALEWETYLQKEELKPAFWIRWYSGDWKFFNDTLSVTFFIISVIFIFSFLLIIFRKRTYINISHWIVLCIFITIIVFLFLDYFPQSI